MAESAAGGRPARAGRPARGEKADAATVGLPQFCRPRFFVRSSNVYSVPLWELPANTRWLPEDLAAHLKAGGSGVREPAAAAAPAPAAAAPVFDAAEDGAPEVPAVEDKDDSGSESEHSEIAWEGPLGVESRVWSRGMVDNSLVLIRRMPPAVPRGGEAAADAAADAASSPGYGLAASAALFSAEALRGGSDILLDQSFGELLKLRDPSWAVLALRSGHFAGIVFRGQEQVVHKTFHRYTQRAKQGGAQSSMDSSGKKPKSAGAQLRRYGEQRLGEEIRELVADKWAAELAACDIIFVSVSKRMKATLVGNVGMPYVQLAKVRRLPFMVGKPTLEAVKEAYLRIASIIIADDQTTERLTVKFKPVAPEEKDEPKAPAPVKEKPTQKEAFTPAPRPEYRADKDELYTPLHAAAATSDEARIAELLDEGADPTQRDSKGRVPYYLCETQGAREAFRRWRGLHEEDWDWQAAQVPEGLTEDMEQQRKDKEKEKKKKQKEKAKANKAMAKEQEEEERKKREEEERALAAAQSKCDSCGVPLTKKPFTRLSFMYCTPECVNNHRRELQAEAAMKRLGGSS